MNFLSTGSSRKAYTAQHIIEFMPKLIKTHVVDMMKENRHISIMAIRRLFNFIRLFAFFIEKDPKVATLLNEHVERFMASPENRHKSKTADLGDI